MSRVSRTGVSILALTAAALAWAPAMAQTGGEAAATGAPPLIDGKRVFPAAYFDKDSPKTAMDMAARVPGFSVEDGDDVRGFGATAGNVLIDGARPTTKGDGLRDILSRIPAQNVERLELLEGAAAGALAPGKTQVLNLVRKAGATSGGTFEAQLTGHSNGYLQPDLEASHTWHLNGFNVTVGAQHEVNQYDNMIGFEGILDPQGAWVERGPNFDQRRSRFSSVNFAVDGTLAGSKVSANASAVFPERSRRWSALAIRTGATAPHRIDQGRETGERRILEAGGDVERAVAGWTAKLALLAKETRDDDLSQAGFNPIGAPEEFSRFTSFSIYGERIGRLTFKRKLGDHQVEFGGEYAFTHLDFDSLFAVGDGAVFTIIPGAIADTRVEERRQEAFVSDSWTLNPKLTLEGVLTGEWSTISQSGDATQERSFFYAKPKLKASWKPKTGWTLRGEIERTVGQLDFGAFADSASLGDGNQNSGNANLRPEQAWVATLGVERRWGERGVATLTLVNEDIEDKLTLVPTQSGGIALGNIPKATRWGYNVSTTVPLDAIAKGLEFSISHRWRDSEHLDAFTLRPRPFSGWDGANFEASVRHDIRSKKLAWGAWIWRGDRSRDFRPDQEFEWTTVQFWGAWVETKAIAGLTVELGMEIPEGNTVKRTRADFVPDRASGRLSRIQYRERSFDGTWYLSVKGKI
jgi:hypothetical protein